VQAVQVQTLLAERPQETEQWAQVDRRLEGTFQRRLRR
jgi:hypothetical protein